MAVPRSQHWNSRSRFFAAAAEAMRRILVEQARRKQTDMHGEVWSGADHGEYTNSDSNHLGQLAGSRMRFPEK